MKTSQDPRHLNRIKRMEALFAYEFQNTENDLKIQNIIDSLSLIDKKITEIAPEWPIEKISKIDLAILRLAVFEITIEQIAPHKVIIDEAVELAKSFGSEGSAKFINGALGALVKEK